MPKGDKPISLYPLSADDAIEAALRTPPPPKKRRAARSIGTIVMGRSEVSRKLLTFRASRSFDFSLTIPREAFGDTVPDRIEIKIGIPDDSRCDKLFT